MHMKHGCFPFMSLSGSLHFGNHDKRRTTMTNERLLTLGERLGLNDGSFGTSTSILNTITTLNITKGILPLILLSTISSICMGSTSLW